MFLFFVQGALSQSNSSTCFSCPASTCGNFGTCSANSCSCLPGFGGPDCFSPLCSSILVDNRLRSINSASSCSCDSGFYGPTCNICSSDSSCPTSIANGNKVCNSSPKVWISQNDLCSIDAPVLKAIYPLDTKLTFSRNIGPNATAYGAVWYNNTQQFMCQFFDCSQSLIDNTTYSYSCPQGSCRCAGNSAFCGGPGTTVSLATPISLAQGSMKFTCPLNSTECNLELEFLKSFFPIGLALKSCSFGECALPSEDPFIDSSSQSAQQLPTAGIVGLAITGLLLLLIITSFFWSLIHLSKQKRIPPSKSSSGLSIAFDNLGYHLGNGKTILSDISGTINPGNILAILGPSGAGKSTLLDILGGKSKRGRISGSISINGTVILQKNVGMYVGYVDQDDLLLPCLTVRETLMFSACLRLPESIGYEEKSSRVDHVLDTLGLSHVADSYVGGFGHRGISGGERRRVSIGVELVTNPGVLLLDEPTSGLDSHSAHSVLEALHFLAEKFKKTIIMTIHQPRSDMYALFHQVLVIKKGSTLYYGQGSYANQYFKEKGKPCPEGYNIADHMLDLAAGKNSGSPQSSTSETGDGGFMTSLLRKRVSTNISTSTLFTDIQNQKPTMLISLETIRGEKYTSGFLTQLFQLVKRGFRSLIRNKSLLLTHWAMAIILGGFIGGVYFRADSTISGFQNRLGSVFFVLSLIGFSSLSSIGAFSQERQLFLRERSNGMYAPQPYFISKIICDLIPLRIIPALFTGTIVFYMVGYTSVDDHFARYISLLLMFSGMMGLVCMCLALAITDVGTATLVGSILILFKMLFAGLIISQDKIPTALRWIQYLSFFRYPYEGIIVNDVGLVTIVDSVQGSDVTIPAATLLEKFGFGIDNYWRDFLITECILIALLVFASVLVQFKLKERR